MQYAEILYMIRVPYTLFQLPTANAGMKLSTIPHLLTWLQFNIVDELFLKQFIHNVEL